MTEKQKAIAEAKKRIVPGGLLSADEFGEIVWDAAIEAAAQHIEHWRSCDCGADEGKKYNTECGHAIDCWWYMTASARELKKG